MHAGFHRHAGMRHVGEPLVDGLRCSPKAASINHFALLVESAVMAPNVAKVDADRQLYLATLPGYFRDEVLRPLLHGNSLRLLRRTCSSHLSGLIAAFWGTFEVFPRISSNHSLERFTERSIGFVTDRSSHVNELL